MSDSSDTKASEAPDAIKRLRRVITLGALALALVHIIWPELSIDAITLVLVVIAVVPWLAPLVKSLQLPGGWKVEFPDLQKAASRAETAGLLAAPAAATPQEYAFQEIAEKDPNLALAGLRIELEKRLVKLARSKGIEPRSYGLGQLLRLLAKEKILTDEEQSVLADMGGLLNSAVHGATVDSRAAEWAMNVGPRLLASLDQRTANVGPA
jgi:hypothetical protein